MYNFQNAHFNIREQKTLIIKKKKTLEKRASIKPGQKSIAFLSIKTNLVTFIFIIKQEIIGHRPELPFVLSANRLSLALIIELLLAVMNLSKIYLYI